jgi:DNA-binding SARP family transcriptional activator
MSGVLDAFTEVGEVRVTLLGGFRVERGGGAREAPDWPRRSAKTLTKLLAVHPGHALHREQIIDVLWPDVDIDSALNSFGKALHAARRALEPGLERRRDSAYLRLTDSMLVLNTDRMVIDVDVFEQLADDAVRSREVGAYHAALAAYSGELLPEDRYEPWCEERRGALAELHVRLLVGIAEVYERRGACNEAADRLRQVLKQDPTREAVHRQLMRLYARMGTPDQAVRQFHVCEQVLRRELDLAPQAETVSLYDAIRTSQLLSAGLAGTRDRAEAGGSLAVRGAHGGAFIGREQVLRAMCEQLTRRDEGRVGMIVISGEAGVGKTRLLEELALRAGEHDAVTLRGGRGAHANRFACGPFAVALEDYAAHLPEPDRDELALRYPALARFVPSLRSGFLARDSGTDLRDYNFDLIPSIAQFLTDLARTRPVLLVLGDLHGIDDVGLDLIRYLAHLAVNMPLLMAGALRDPDVEPDPGLRQMIEAMTRERLWTRIELRCLSRRATDQLVRALLPGVAVSEGILAEIYEQSRGNPLFVRELAGAMRGDPSAPTVGPHAAASLTARTRALAELRLALMDKPLHQVLGLAATAGAKEISLSQLRAGAAALEPPLTPAALLDALDRALRMRLLEEREGGYAFRHPVLRTALYDSLPRHRRDEFRAALAELGCAPPAAPDAAGNAAGSPVEQDGGTLAQAGMARLGGAGGWPAGSSTSTSARKSPGWLTGRRRLLRASP